MLALGHGSQTRSAGVSRLPTTPARRVTRLNIRASRQEGPTGWVTTSNKKVIAVCGFGPGISSAVASLWASKGFDVALLSRTQARLDKAAEELKAKGVNAAGYAVDLAQPDKVKSALARVAEDMGPVTVLFYNPAAHSWGDVLSIPPEVIADNMSHQVTGLIAAIQAVVPGQEKVEGAAILVTGGSLALVAENHNIAKLAGKMGGIAVSAGKAAQRALVHSLAEELKHKGIRVAEVVVAGGVKGSASAGDRGTIAPEEVAEDFWKLYEEGVGGPVSVTRG